MQLEGLAALSDSAGFTSTKTIQIYLLAYLRKLAKRGQGRSRGRRSIFK